MRRSSGTIFLSRASTSPCMPSRRGTLNPQMSASSTPTVRPRRARATARFTVTELLPTPPLPEAMATTRAVSGMSVAGGSSRAMSRARAMTACFCSASMTPVVTVDRPDAREGPHVQVDVTLDLGPQRASGDGQGHLDRDIGPVDPDPGDHAELDDVGAELGVASRGAGRRGPRPRWAGARRRRGCRSWSHPGIRSGGAVVRAVVAPAGVAVPGTICAWCARRGRVPRDARHHDLARTRRHRPVTTNTEEHR